MHNKNLSNLKIFQLILWTNWQTSKRKLWQFFFVIVSPSIFCFGLLMTQLVFDVQTSENYTYEPIDLVTEWKFFIQKIQHRDKILRRLSNRIDFSPFMPQVVLGYAPNNHIAFQKIMDYAINNYLSNVTYYGFRTCNELRSTIINEFYIGGICFDVSTMNLETETIYMVRGFPTYLSFTIIYPRELRMYQDTYIGNVWRTEKMYDSTDMYDQRNELQNDGGFVGYLREGFTSIQHAISMAYIQLTKHKHNTVDIKSQNATENLELILPKIFIQRYPYYQSKFTTTSKRLCNQLPIVTMCGYLCSAILLTMRLYEYKNKYDNLRISKLGMRKWLQVLAWLVEGSVLLVFASLLQIIILKIPWYGNTAIWPKASITALLFFLTAYSISLLCFCFMITSFFSNSSLGVITTCLCVIISIFPGLWIINGDKQFQFNMKTALTHILFNTVMGFAYNDILEFEELKAGFGWQSYVDGTEINRTMILAVFVLIFYFLSGLYIGIGLYILYLRETLFIWDCLRNLMYFIGISKLRKKKNTLGHRMSIIRFSKLSKVFQIKSVLEIATIRIKNLTKLYDDIEVVYDISTDLYENEITILMGHNGSGKTTFLYMLAGLIKPTNGSIRYYNFKLQQYVKSTARSIGYAMSDDILLNDLTPSQQLNFICQLKAVPKAEIDAECTKYINAVQLEPWLSKRTKELPYGVRKLLAICCALIGGSKLVLLDEPGSGVDMHLRKLYWDLLTQEKHGRTILLTSHSMAEAEAVGDRIMIICKGELNCDGSSFFLKHIYGSPLRLICTQRENCLAEKVTRFIAEFIPGIQPDCELGTELYYIIDNKYLEVIEQLLIALEQEYDNLSLQRCYVRECNIDDIFYKMGTADSSHGIRRRHQEIMSGVSVYTEEYELLQFIQENQKVGELCRFGMNLKALLLKHYLNTIRKKSIIIVNLLMPIVIICFLHKSNIVMYPLNKTVSLTFNLLDYNNSITVMERHKNLNPTVKAIENEYSQMIQLFGSENQLVVLDDDTFSNYILQKQLTAKDRVNHLYIVGVTIKNDTIIAWFNNFPLHTAPLSLNLIHRAMVRSLLNKHARISVTIENLPFTAKNTIILKRNTSMKFTYFFYFYIYAVCITFATSVMELITEQQSHFKLQQFISGARLFTFWLCVFISDIIKIMAMCTVTVLTIMLMAYINHHDFISFTFAIYIITSIIFAGACIMPFNYFLSLFFKDPIVGYIVVFNIGSFLITTYIIYDNSLAIGYSETIQSIFVYHVVPYFSLCALILKVTRMSYQQNICSLDEIRAESLYQDKCQTVPHCCRKRELLDWHNGIGKDIFALFAVGVMSWLAIWLIETRKTRKITNLFTSIPKDDLKSARAEHEKIHSKQNKVQFDVLYERFRVKSLKSNEFKKTPVICENVFKKHFNENILQRTHLLLDRSEIFAVMGVSGCGKSTLLKTLVGELKLTCGRIRIDGLILNDDLYEVYTHIGYCPQIDDLPKHFCVREIMHILCILRGVSKAQIPNVCESLAKVLGFFEHYYKPISICTNGICRRISCAIALLGNPSIIFMDEPDTHIDIAGKRQLWNILQKLKNRNKTIMIATLSTQTAEIICDRVAIMSKGRFLLIGKPFDIDSYLLEKGYILKIKLKRFVQHNINEVLQNVEEFIRNQFKSSILKCRYGYILKFFIPTGSINAGQIYKIMQMNAFILHIEHFILSRAHISTIFLDVANTEQY